MADVASPIRRGRGQLYRRIGLGPGAELLLDERHPLFEALEDDAIADLLRRALDVQGDRP